MLPSGRSAVDMMGDKQLSVIAHELVAKELRQRSS
jgi:hypothetical protein